MIYNFILSALAVLISVGSFFSAEQPKNVVNEKSLSGGDSTITTMSPLKYDTDNIHIIPKNSSAIIGSASTNATFNIASTTTLCLTADCRTTWPSGSGAGTVTSVGIEVPTGLSVTTVGGTGAATSTITWLAGYQPYTSYASTTLETLRDTQFTQAIASTTFQPIILSGTYDPYGQATSSINALTFNYPLSRATNAISIVATSSMAINTDDLIQGATNKFMTYPGAGIALSSGSAWSASITNNSANWNTAYGWGNHAGLYDPLGQATSTKDWFLTQSNTYTGALQTFINASTTQIGSTGSAYFATAGGNVGIGTTSPRVAFDVNGSAEFLGSLSVKDGAANRITMSYTGGTSVISTIAQFGWNLTANHSSGPSITFGTGSGGATAEKMRIANDGSVGIGTTTPNTLLDINGNAALENQGQLRLYQLRANGAFYASLSASTTPAMTANANWTWARVDGTPLQVLATNGKGNLYFTSQPIGTRWGEWGAGTILGPSNGAYSSTVKIAIGYSDPNTATAMLSVNGLTSLTNASSTLFSSSSASTTSLLVSGRNILGTFDKSANIGSTTLDYLGNKFSTASSTFNLWNPSVAVGSTALYCKTSNGTATVEMGNGTASSTAVCTTSGTAITSALTWTARADVNFVLKDTAASAASRITITGTFYNQ